MVSRTLNSSDPRFQYGGASAPMSGERYFSIDDGIKRAWLAAPLVAAGGKPLDEALSRADLLILGSERRRLQDRCGEVDHFPSRNLAETPGWSGNSFFLPDGCPITPTRQIAGAEAAFLPDRTKCTVRGTLTGWKRKIAKPLSGQNLPAFLIMAAFAGPLLQLTNRSMNILFEVVGGAATGKSLALKLASTVLGGVNGGADGQYWVSMNATSNSIEEQTLTFCDSLMVVDEAQLYCAGEPPRTRETKMRELIFRLAEGRQKGRYGETVQRRFSLIGIMSANQSIDELQGGSRDSLANAGMSRLNTLRVWGQEFGIFDFVPKRFGGSRHFAQYLQRQASRQHGTAIRAFLQQLVDLRDGGEAKLRRDIAARIEEFYQLVGVGPDSGSEGRIAEAFAIVAVAGRLAKHFGVLPDEWNPMEIAAECYRQRTAEMMKGEQIADVLRAYANRTDIIDLAGGPSQLADEEFDQCPGFCRSGPDGKKELVIPVKSIRRVIPDWEHRKLSISATGIIRADAGRDYDKKVRMRRGKPPERAIVFKI